MPKSSRSSRNLAGAVSLPDSIRYHPAAHHPLTGRRHPALFAKVAGGNRFGIAKVWLTSDGRKADLPETVMHGCRGGAVRMRDGDPVIGEPEGVLIAAGHVRGLQISTSLWSPSRVWAAVSDDAVARVHLPGKPGRLVIDVTGDGARYLADRAAEEGWKVAFWKD